MRVRGVLHSTGSTTLDGLLFIRAHSPRDQSHRICSTNMCMKYRVIFTGMDIRGVEPRSLNGVAFKGYSFRVFDA